ncbi:hypothetical protein EDC39_10353 [Geothermobacter ehrlichii]|uniref:Lipoprotein n=1 Tax=Geothermobacter ehrlichii TaxID=213224 RepID=A0A5D3WKM1_9BACT|nr:hypothetical protein [Geothermobacter ehrlichii]TYO99210.1 hypothetical protein EDC39_10353 [Geothermobacter ehrlichii]
MRKSLLVLVAVLVSLGLTACATTKANQKTRVKCPACGYEFKVPAQNP